MDVYNGCATAATALQLTADAIRSGQYDIGVAVGMDKHAARRVHVRPRRLRRPALVRRDRATSSPRSSSRMKINRYMHDHGISPRDPGEGGGQELPQRRAQPERVPAQAHLRGGHPRVADAQLPAHPVHVLRARRGRGRGRAVQGRHRPPVHVDADLPAGHDAADPSLRRLRGARLVGRGRAGRTRRPCTRRRPPTSRPASAPRTST